MGKKVKKDENVLNGNYAAAPNSDTSDSRSGMLQIVDDECESDDVNLPSSYPLDNNDNLCEEENKMNGEDDDDLAIVNGINNTGNDQLLPSNHPSNVSSSQTK